jgi:hypothetical protein
MFFLSFSNASPTPLALAHVWPKLALGQAAASLGRFPCLMARIGAPAPMVKFTSSKRRRLRKIHHRHLPIRLTQQYSGPCGPSVLAHPTFLPPLAPVPGRQPLGTRMHFMNLIMLSDYMKALNSTRTLPTNNEHFLMHISFSTTFFLLQEQQLNHNK